MPATLHWRIVESQTIFLKLPCIKSILQNWLIFWGSWVNKSFKASKTYISEHQQNILFCGVVATCCMKKLILAYSPPKDCSGHITNEICHSIILSKFIIAQLMLHNGLKKETLRFFFLYKHHYYRPLLPRSTISTTNSIARY